MTTEIDEIFISELFKISIQSTCVNVFVINKDDVGEGQNLKYASIVLTVSSLISGKIYIIVVV